MSMQLCPSSLLGRNPTCIFGNSQLLAGLEERGVWGEGGGWNGAKLAIALFYGFQRPCTMIL